MLRAIFAAAAFVACAFAVTAAHADVFQTKVTIYGDVTSISEGGPWGSYIGDFSTVSCSGDCGKFYVAVTIYPGYPAVIDDSWGGAGGFNCQVCTIELALGPTSGFVSYEGSNGGDGLSYLDIDYGGGIYIQTIEDFSSGDWVGAEYSLAVTGFDYYSVPESPAWMILIIGFACCAFKAEAGSHQKDVHVSS